MVTSPMQVGVIGHPIGQSLSPLLHTRWIKAFDLDAVYTAIDGKDPETFRHIVKDCLAKGWKGLNVTIPFKADALAMADHVTPRAKAIGAVNLLIFRGGKIYGDNTDAAGFQDALTASKWAMTLPSARVLGAGGAAPAILTALKDMGFTDISLTNRTLERAENVAHRIGGVTPLAWEDRDQGLEAIGVVVNTTSLGMVGQPPLDFSLNGLPETSAVIDIITTPLQTMLLQTAEERAHFTMKGLPMLVYQAIPSFEAWFGLKPADGEDAVAFLTREKTASP
ncbi:MAG: shikimate dehydrogenase [Pseudomonadota bacterium]